MLAVVGLWVIMGVVIVSAPAFTIDAALESNIRRCARERVIRLPDTPRESLATCRELYEMIGVHR